MQVTPVTAGLDDRHPYVRRTAVMGVLKIWHMNPGMLSLSAAPAAAAAAVLAAAAICVTQLRALQSVPHSSLRT
jgi:vesicle coat complex subunit